MMAERRRFPRPAEERAERHAPLALLAVEERGEGDGREGAPYLPPSRNAGVRALEAYRFAYHRGTDRRRDA